MASTSSPLAASSSGTPQVSLKKKKKGPAFDLDELRKTIIDQQKFIRHLKIQGAPKSQILEEAHRLLELKFHDPENTEVVEPKSIKIRWVTPRTDGSKTRLQYTFRSRTSVLGSEVIDMVQNYTAQVASKKKLIVCGSLLKLERVLGPKKHVAVSPLDRFQLEIVNPGPTLEDERIFNFVATWSQVSPSEVYHSLPHVPELIDAGVNLFDPTMVTNTNKIVRRAFRAGVSQMILISTNPQTSTKNMSFIENYQKSVFAVVGIHPCDASKVPADALSSIEAILANPENKGCVGVGEIGLDYSSHAGAPATSSSSSSLPQEEEEEEEGPLPPSSSGSSSAAVSTVVAIPATPTTTGDSTTPITGGDSEGTAASSSSAVPVEAPFSKEVQKRFFEEQLLLAVKYKLPVLVHVRDAHADCLELLKRYRADLPAIMIFCFSETESELKEYLALDCYICITGLLCNDARGGHLRPLIQTIPRDRLILASDAPYLTPFSHMSKPYPKFNEPCYLPSVALAVSEVFHSDVSLSELAELTTNNTRRFFNLPTPFFDGKKEVQERKISPSAATESMVLAIKETAASHTKVDLTSFDVEALPTLRPGQCYFSHGGSTYAVSLEISALLTKQRELLGDGPSFMTLLTDLVSLENKRK